MDEETKLMLEFRKIHGPLPGGRSAQGEWSKKWAAYKEEHLKCQSPD